MVLIEKVNKSYKGVKALVDINLTINQGELFGLIGPDGAGKTTLFRLMTTLLLPSKGSISILDYDTKVDYQKIREIVGYMPGKFSLYKDLTVKENVEIFASLFNTKMDENIDIVKGIYNQLAPFENRYAEDLSGGMKQKLALCCALIHKPKILFLDEPTTGVDPMSRKEFWEILDNLKKEGITIIVSTPYMDEASKCDRIALIQKGAILTVNTPDVIESEYPAELFKVSAKNMFQLLQYLKKHPQAASCFPFGDSHHFELSQKASKRGFTIENLINELNNMGFEEVKVKKIKAKIEDCFMYLSR
jgi:ABC-type multidrug transport system ATPase subunit